MIETPKVDALLKREQFAIKLRKGKKSKILEQKRANLKISKTEVMT